MGSLLSLLLGGTEEWSPAARRVAAWTAAYFALRWLFRRIRRGVGPDRVAGRVALVTGGASGIGLETAKILAGRGAGAVVLWDLDEAAMAAAAAAVADAARAAGFRAENRLAAPLPVPAASAVSTGSDGPTEGSSTSGVSGVSGVSGEFGGAAQRGGGCARGGGVTAGVVVVAGYRVDVSDRAAVYAAAERVGAEVGPVQVLVNNAGIVSGRPLLEAPDGRITKTLEINTLAHLWTCKAFLPGMKKAGTGHIANVASAAGLIGAPSLTDYSASKFGAVGFAQSLRLELMKEGVDIGVSVLCPAHVKTKLFAGFSTILPSLEPSYVASRIVQSVDDRQFLVCMPRLVYVSVALATVLPVAVVDVVGKVTGLTTAMDHFVPKAANKTFSLAGTDADGDAEADGFVQVQNNRA